MIITNRGTQAAKTTLHGSFGRAQAQKAARSGKYPMGVYVEISKGTWERHTGKLCVSGKIGDYGFCVAILE